MVDRLARIEIFVRVVEEGSFSAAARALKTRQPSISKAVAELEKQLKTRLLHRTTRTLSPTEAGAAYYARVKRLVTLLQDADDHAVAGQASIRGRLRVNTSALLAGRLVMPTLLDFKALHPAVEIELAMDDRRIDLVEQATDVAVRIGALSNSTLKARRAGSAPIGMFASPKYLARVGKEAAEITGFTGLHFVRYAGQSTASPGLAEGHIAITVANGLLASEACVAGAGVAAIPLMLAADDVALGRIVPILPDYALPAMEVSLLHPFPQDTPPSVTAFIEFAIESWRRDGLLHA